MDNVSMSACVKIMRPFYLLYFGHIDRTPTEFNPICDFYANALNNMYNELLINKVDNNNSLIFHELTELLTFIANSKCATFMDIWCVLSHAIGRCWLDTQHVDHKLLFCC